MQAISQTSGKNDGVQMIIFDLDGTLADCEHRRHFITPPDRSKFIYTDSTPHENGCVLTGYWECQGKKWQPDWLAFYEACDKDKIISQTKSVFDFIGMNGQSHTLQIWTGRSQSVEEKTKIWLRNYSFAYACHEFNIVLKMRPIGNTEPDEVLKERWLDEAIAEGKKIDFVFDDRPKVVRMWRRRGIFVFNCCQHDEEF